MRKNPDLFQNLQVFKLVQPPYGLKHLAHLLCSIFVIFVLMLCLVPWQQTTQGTGRVLAYSPNERPQNIDAPVEGRLGHWFVQEGSHVEKGDPIVEIIDNDPEILNRLQQEKRALLARLEAARVSAQTAKIHVDRQAILVEQGLSSKRSYELAKLDYTKFLTDEANAKAEISRIDVRLSRQTTQSVKAPMSGTILRRISGESSVLVKSGSTLAAIVPNTTSRAVELWIDGNDIPLVREGNHVRLQFAGWPAIQFSGWPSVAVGTFGGKISVVDAADGGDGNFRVLVVPNDNEPWPSSHYLRQGIRAHGWVLLGRVRLGYELWRKFNGFPPIVSKSEPSHEKSNSSSDGMKTGKDKGK